MVGVSPSLLPPSFVVGELLGFDRLSCVTPWLAERASKPAFTPKALPLAV